MTIEFEPTLFETKQYAIAGVISAITPDGGSAIARLDHKINGFDLAIISHQTRGRADLMSKGLFHVGAKIRFDELKRGGDAFKAVAVSPA